MELSSLFFQIDNIQTLALCLGIFFLLSWYFMKPKNIPPGPFKWPLIGNLPTLVLSLFTKEPKHKLMTRMGLKYGKIISVDIAGNSVIVLNDAKVIKEAFQKPELCARPLLPFEGINAAERDTLVNGDIWTQHRRFSLSVFRNAGVGKTTFDDQIAEEAALLCDAIEQLSGQPVNPKPLLMQATANMICSIAFGKHYDYNDSDFCQLLAMIEQRPRLLGSGFMIVPIYRKLFGKQVAAFIELTNKGMSFVRQVVEDHREVSRKTDDCKDYIDLYLKNMEQKKNEEESTKKFTQERLAHLMDILFGAGSETSSNTLAWCLLRLIADPDMQQQIRDEIFETCGEDRLPTYSDRSRMPFTEAFLLEVQRLYTIVPLGVPHSAEKTTTLEGYTIPKGSILMSNLWAVHHDPDVWDNPDEFKPTRFLDQDGKVIKKDEWMPFCTGRRMCLGERIAKMEMFIFFTHLVRRFTFTNADPTSPLTFKGQNGVTYAPEEYCLYAKKIE